MNIYSSRSHADVAPTNKQSQNHEMQLDIPDHNQAAGHLQAF